MVGLIENYRGYKIYKNIGRGNVEFLEVVNNHPLTLLIGKLGPNIEPAYLKQFDRIATKSVPPGAYFFDVSQSGKNNLRIKDSLQNIKKEIDMRINFTTL